jgi:hypothetical protein
MVGGAKGGFEINYGSLGMRLAIESSFAMKLAI